MQESIIIQPNNEGIAQAEAFIEHVCEATRLVNEFGVISVATLQLVLLAVREEGQGSIGLSYGYCDGGIYVELTGLAKGLDLSDKDDPKMNEPLFLIKSLADHIAISDDGNTIRLVFFVNGIEVMHARSRQSVLQEFFAAKSVEA